jgi:phosphoribosylanthranilate isomerase
MTAVGVKICGLTRRPDAELVAASGAHYGGVILAPGGRRSITPGAAAALFDRLPLRRVGVFVDAPPSELVAAAETAALDVLQLHGEESPEAAAALRRDGRWAVWKAIRPRSASEYLRELGRYADSVDGILLDGWSPDAPGGTGSRFPWEEVAAHLGDFPRSLHLIVAGGLTPESVAAAVELLHPAVVDVSSGVEEAPGRKSSAAVSAFLAAVRGAAVDPFP